MLVEFGGFLRRGVDFSRNPRLVDLSRFLVSVEFTRFLRYRVDFSRSPRLWFGVRAAYYRVFLFVTGVSK